MMLMIRLMMDLWVMKKKWINFNIDLNIDFKYLIFNNYYIIFKNLTK
jgi:hypothetical protein